MSKITPFLMYVDSAEAAADLYTKVFKNSRIISKSKGPDGKVNSVSFELEGQHFRAYDGGEHFKFTDGVSLFVDCEDQAEVDYYWEKLTSDGGAPIKCGWLKDKYGLCWQIIPKQLMKYLGNSDPEKAKRAMDAMLKMTKIDISKLEEAVS